MRTVSEGTRVISAFVLWPLLSLSFLVLPVHADDRLNLKAWIGEWGHLQTQGDEEYGVSLSIPSCDSDTHKCPIRFYSVTPGTRAQCQGNAVMTVEGDSDASAVVLNYSGDEEDCHFNLHRSANAGHEGISFGFHGVSCKRFCTEEPNFAPDYARRSEAPFREDETPSCYADSRKTATIWCTEPEVIAISTRWKNGEDRLYQLDGNKNYSQQSSEKKSFEDALVTKCEASSDQKNCLVKGLTERLAEIDRLSKRSAERVNQKDTLIEKPGDPEEGTQASKDLEGAYRHTFTNGLVSGESFQSEDILEIFPIDKSTFYFRVHLSFFNAHSCSASGVAEYRASKQFFYESEKDPGTEDNCMLVFGKTTDSVTIDIYHSPLSRGESTCERHCGTRGSLHNVSLPLKSRRKITYGKIIERSEQFQSAVAEYKKVRESGTLR